MTTRIQSFSCVLALSAPLAAWSGAAPSSPPPAPPASTEPAASEVLSGEQLFKEANPRCTLCHSVAGRGNRSGVALDGVGTRLSRDEIKAWIRTPVEMAKKRGSTRKPAMVPFPEFTDEEVDAMVGYLADLPPTN